MAYYGSTICLCSPINHIAKIVNIVYVYVLHHMFHCLCTEYVFFFLTCNMCLIKCYYSIIIS
jgi:hypothetical protein